MNLPAARLRVVQSRSAAGERDVTLRPALMDELTHLRAQARGDQSARVFGTSTGQTRVLAKAVERANVSLAVRELSALRARLTPHSLRRTFVSLLAALNEPTTDIMREAGHTASASGCAR